MGSKKVACKKSASDHLLRFASSCLHVCMFNQIRNGQGSKGQILFTKNAWKMVFLILLYMCMVYASTIMTGQGNCFITYLFYNHVILKLKGIRLSN